MTFIVLSAGSVGFGMACSVKKKIGILRQMVRALQLLRNEIAFCGTPLPQAFALMAASCEGLLGQQFEAIAKTMDKHPWMTAAEAMRQSKSVIQDLTVESLLNELTEGLGKYDLEAQLQAISFAKNRTDTLLLQAEQEQNSKSKLYETLGICAGLSIAILLI